MRLIKQEQTKCDRRGNNDNNNNNAKVNNKGNSVCGVEWYAQYLISIIWLHFYWICKTNSPQKMWYMNRFWTLHLVLNDHLYKYTAETRFYDRQFNDIRDGTVSTDFCVQVKVTVNRLYHGFFDTILTSRQPRGKLPCLYDNLMSKNFRKKTILKKKNWYEL